MRIYAQWFFILLYSILLILGLKNHELWLDEMHHWLLAKDSTSLTELYINSRYEGHPILWNILLFVISRFTDNPIAMQILHGFLAFFVACFIIFATPFPVYLRIFLLFGYFTFYEYAIISRSYVLITLLVLVVSYIYNHFPQKKWIIISLLFLLANTHLLAIPIVLGFLVFFFWKKWTRKDYLLAILALSGLMIALWQITPPNNHPFHSYWSRLHFDFKLLLKTFNQIGQGLLPLSDFEYLTFWNRSLLSSISSFILPILSFIFFYILAKQTFFNQKLRISILITFTGIFTILYFLQMIGFRYYGIIWVACIPVYWFLYTQKQKRIFLLNTFSVIAFIQMLAGIITYSLDIQKPFSQAKYVVEFIQENHLENIPLAVSTANAAPSISGYLKKYVYHLDIAEYRSFCLWYKPVKEKNQKKLLNNLISFTSHSTQVLLAINYMLHKEDLAYLDNLADIRLIKYFSPSIVQSENYWLYLIRRK